MIDSDKMLAEVGNIKEYLMSLDEDSNSYYSAIQSCHDLISLIDKECSHLCFSKSGQFWEANILQRPSDKSYYFLIYFYDPKTLNKVGEICSDSEVFGKLFDFDETLKLMYEFVDSNYMECSE